MPCPNAARPAAALASRGPRTDLPPRKIELTDTTLSPKLKEARLRQRAWIRILDAIAEQRAALEHRIYREDPDDRLLAADCQTWCELALALSDFLRARTSLA